jgi:hypothetical protein
MNGHVREPRYRLVLGALLWAVAVRAQPPAAVPAPAPPGRTQNAAPPASQDVPDEEFIEFLGEDDHGDAAWSEFLKRAQHGAQNPTPPQGTKQS